MEAVRFLMRAWEINFSGSGTWKGMNLKELASFSDRLHTVWSQAQRTFCKKDAGCTIQYNFIAKCQYNCTRNVFVVPSVNTIAQRMFCGAKYTDHRTMVHLGVITCKSFANKMLSKQLNSFGKQCHTTYSEYIINVVISVTLLMH